MRIKLYILSVLTLIFSGTIHAQVNDTSDSESGITKNYFNFGFGTSSWGFPVYANVEFPIATVEHLTVAIGGSYQTKKESYGYFYGNTSWRHTIVGVQAAGNYYLDDLIDLSEQFDLYGGLQLDYYIWKTKLLDNDITGFSEDYVGSGSGGLGLSGLVGGRYHFGGSQKLSLNIILGAGTVFSTGRIGLSMQL